MSAIAASAVVTLGEFAIQALTAYNKAKADAATAQVALDAGKIATLNQQLVAGAAGDDTADKQLDTDLENKPAAGVP